LKGRFCYHIPSRIVGFAFIASKCHEARAYKINNTLVKPYKSAIAARLLLVWLNIRWTTLRVVSIPLQKTGGRTTRSVVQLSLRRLNICKASKSRWLLGQRRVLDTLGSIACWLLHSLQTLLLFATGSKMARD